MHIINKYCYNTRKNIFYDKDLSKEEIDIINAKFPDDDLYESAMDYFNTVDFSNLNSAKYMPKEGGLCLTYNCQLRCTYCAHSSSEGSKHNLLTESDVQIFINYLIKNLTIHSLQSKKPKKMTIPITGAGEPTYSWTFFKNIINYISEKCQKNKIEYEISLTTNGMLNEEQVDFICENVSSVMISYDGHADFQNKNRITNSKQPSADIVERTIKMFDEKNKIPVNIRTTIWHDDFDYLQKMADNIYNKYNNFNKWSINPISPFGRAINEYNPLNENNFVKAFFDIVYYVTDKYKKFNVETMAFNTEISDAMMYCGSGLFKYPWLMPNRDINTCIETTQIHPTIGRINNGKVEFYDNYEDKLMMICKDVFENCRDCIAFRFCKGGCPMRMFGDNYEKGKLSWGCRTQQIYTKYRLENIITNKDGNNCKCIFEKIESEDLKNINVFKLNGRCKCDETKVK